MLKLINWNVVLVVIVSHSAIYFLTIFVTFFYIIRYFFLSLVIFYFVLSFGMSSSLSGPHYYLRSRYAGGRWSLRKPDFRYNLGAQVLGTALNSLRFDKHAFSPLLRVFYDEFLLSTTQAKVFHC